MTWILGMEKVEANFTEKELRASPNSKRKSVLVLFECYLSDVRHQINWKKKGNYG
jgi:hypothetical protein